MSGMNDGSIGSCLKLPLLGEAVLQDHGIKDLSARDAFPSEKMFTYAVEFLVDHDSAATMAFHNNLPSIVNF